MARKTYSFDMFGVEYRTKQYSAARGMEVLAIRREIYPLELLETTEVRAPDGKWYPLSDRGNVNALVVDRATILSPLLVLRGLISLVSEYQFDFLNHWKGVKIPSRFLSGSTSVTSKHVDPVLAQVMSKGMSTLERLEEYYSLEDAFVMFDVIMSDGLSQALANEEAAKNAKG